MTRRGFTLVEVLAAVTLSAALVATGGSWLLGLQRSAVSTRDQCRRQTAMASTAVRLRADTMLATPDQPLGSRDGNGAWLLTITGAHGGARQCVAWSVREGRAIRAVRPLAGTRWTEEVVASGIDSLEIDTKPKGGPRLRVVAGADELSCNLVAGAADAP